MVVSTPDTLMAKRPNLFLRTKLIPPRTVPDLLTRPRLIERLRANLSAPLTLVAADAGCGKTTLIADFIRGVERPSVWYQLDHTDSDPSVFLGYIVEGIRNVVPDFGEAINDYLADVNEELLQFPERAADVLINEILNSLENPLIVVLDDYHHIGTETNVHRIVDRILQYSSDLVHLMITTRDLPPLPTMRRRSQSAVSVITREDLLFTDEEVKELFRSALGKELEDREIHEYRSRTHGWITALQLVRQVAEQESQADGRREIDLVEMLKRSEKDIFDYFAEEVFGAEPEEVRRLLLHISLLETLPLEVCSLLFPDLRCSALLPGLAQKNLFLTVTGDARSGEEYRLHPLFRDFLQRRLRSEIGKAGVDSERNRVADEFIRAGKWESAIPFLIEAANYKQAAQLLAEHGHELIAAGAFVTLESFSNKVPLEELRMFPSSLLHVAEVARLQGNTVKAMASLNAARSLFQDAGDRAYEAESLHSLASIERRRGNLQKAREHLDEAERLAEPDSETLLKCANTRGLCLIAEGKWTEAEQQLRYALDIAENRSSRHYQRLVMHNLALGPGFRGDFGEALRWFRRIFSDDGAGRKLPQEAIGHLNVARLHLYRGEFDEVRKHLDRSLELCQVFNIRHLRPEIFEAFANYYRDIEDYAHADEYYERAMKAYEEAEIDFSTKELLEERARFFIRRGDTVRARALLESLRSARETRSSPLSLKTVELGLSQIDLMEGRKEGLSQRVIELREYFHTAGHYYDEALASLLAAEVLAAEGNEKDAVTHLNRVLDLSARFDYDFWLRREMRRLPDLFLIEDIAERLPADLRKEASGTSPAPAGASVAATQSPSQSPLDLTVSLLGPIELIREPERPFATDAWTTRRARDIFCFIASSKYRRVAKDVLIDTFWPDDEPKVVEKNFHPTISHIRKALNSRQTLKQNFLVFRDGAYQLNPDLTYLIDVEEFDRLLSDAEAAKRDNDNGRLRASLEGAYALYRGEFMPGVYEDWAEERRKYYAEQFGRVAGALAKLSLAERRLADARRFAAEVLKLDPYREDMYRLTLKLLAGQGKKPAAKKYYDEMVRLFDAELGVAPSPGTRKLAAELGLDRSEL